MRKTIRRPHTPPWRHPARCRFLCWSKRWRLCERAGGCALFRVPPKHPPKHPPAEPSTRTPCTKAITSVASVAALTMASRATGESERNGRMNERQTLLDRIGEMCGSDESDRHSVSVLIGVYSDTDPTGCETQELFRAQLTEGEALGLAKRIKAMNPAGE